MEEIKEEIQKLKIEIKETLEGLNQSKSEVIAIDAKDYKERYGRSQPWKTRLEDPKLNVWRGPYARSKEAFKGEQHE